MKTEKLEPAHTPGPLVVGQRNIQICAFNSDGVGIDSITETLAWYDSPKAGRIAARGLLDKYAEIDRVWIRKINAGHLRTVAMVTR